jgi:hypothetical protein
MSASNHLSFGAWIRPRLRWIVLVALVGAIGLLLFPLFLLQFPVENRFWIDAVAANRIGLFGAVHARTGLGLQAQLWLLPMVAALIIGAALFVLEFLLWRWRWDPADDAWSSWTWSLCSWRTGLVLTLVVWVPTWGLPAAFSGSDFQAVVSGVALALPSLAIALCWFLVFNPVNLVPADPPSRWRGRWPGWRAVVVTAVVTGTLAAIDFLCDAWSPNLLSFFADLILWIPFLALQTACALLWLGFRPSFLAALRGLVRSPQFRSVFLQNLRLGLWFEIGLAGLVLPAAMLNIFFFPQVEEYLQSRHLSMPAAWSWLQTLVRAGSQDQLDFVLLPFEWWFIVANARLLAQLFGPASGYTVAAAGVPSGLRSSIHNPAHSLRSIS